MEQDVTHAARINIRRVNWPHVNFEKTAGKELSIIDRGLVPSLSAILALKRAAYYTIINMFRNALARGIFFFQ